MEKLQDPNVEELIFRSMLPNQRHICRYVICKMKYICTHMYVHHLHLREGTGGVIVLLQGMCHALHSLKFTD